MTILHMDFETSSRIKIGEVGVHRYVEDRSTEIICFCYAFDDEPVQVAMFSDMPDRVAKHIHSGGIVYAHNATMEREVLETIHGFSFVNMRCTSAVASYNALPAALGALAGHLNLDIQKDKEGAKVLARHYTTPPREIPQEDLEVIVKYCMQDVEVEREIHRILGDLPAQELKVWQLDQKMNNRGVCFDSKLATNCIDKMESAKDSLNAELLRLTDGKVERPTQGARIIKWLAERGVKAKDMAKDTVADLLTCELDDDVREVLLNRQRGSGSSTRKFAKGLEMVGMDGRIRGSLKYHGATTGRWAGSGIQPQNLPRGNVNDTDALADAIVQHDWDTAVSMAGNVFDAGKSAIRPMLKARDGKTLFIVDYSSIEARVLAWYAGQSDLVQAFHDGADIYCTFAEKVFKRAITKADKKERMIGKQAVLGLGYGMGARKFQATLGSFGTTVTLDFAQSVVDTYREAYPNIRNLWYSLDRGAVEAVQYGESKDGKWFAENGVLHFTLPSGRLLRYQSCKLFTNKFDKPAVSYRRPLGKNFVWSDSYGGKWCENVCQAIARDVMVDSMLDLDRAGHKLILTVHDEVVIEGDVEKADLTLKEIESIMVKPRQWCVGLPTAVEGDHNFRFKK